MSGGVVSFTGAGTCTLDVNQAGSTNYVPANQVQQSFSVVVTQMVAFTSTPPPAAAVGGATYAPNAIASSGLAATISVDSASSGSARSRAAS